MPEPGEMETLHRITDVDIPQSSAINCVAHMLPSTSRESPCDRSTAGTVPEDDPTAIERPYASRSQGGKASEQV